MSYKMSKRGGLLLWDIIRGEIWLEGESSSKGGGGGGGVLLWGEISWGRGFDRGGGGGVPNLLHRY